MNLPAWKEDLLGLLDKHTPARLVEQYKDGGITDKAELYLTLGIDPQTMRSPISVKINYHIIDKHSTQTNKRYLTADEAALFETLGDVLNDVGQRI